jgi:competence protein ComEC
MRTAGAALTDRSRAGPDLRLAPAAALSWAGAAWGVASAAGEVAAAGGVLLAAAPVLLALLRPSAPWAHRLPGSWRGLGAAFAVAACCAAAVLLSAAVHLHLRSSGVIGELVPQRVTVEATAVVLGDPRPVRPRPDAAPWAADQERVVVRVRAEHVSGRGLDGPARAPLLVLGGSGWADVRPGNRLTVSGLLLPAEPADDVVALLAATGGPRQVVSAPGWQRHAEQLRAGLRRASGALPADAGGLLPGLVVGDTSGVSPELEEAMRRVGLTHLVAVSGANVAIVCGTVLVVAAACGAGRWLRLLLATAALVGFVVLARPDPSVQRAAVMGAIALFGLGTGRRGRGLPVLCAAVVALTAADPWLARSFAFALSVLATGALLLLAAPMADGLGRVLPRVLAQAIAVPAAAQAVCAPVVVLLNPGVPLLAVPANLLVAPAVAPATVLGVVATVAAALWLPAAQVVAWVAGVATGWIAWVAHGSAAVPGATLPWPSGMRGAVLLATVTALALLLAVPALRLLPRARRLGWLTAVVAAGCVAALVVVAAVRWLPSSGWPPPGWRVVACDVGQGDALVVATRPGGAIVVDAGPEPGAVDRCLRRLGITVVDLLVLTHFHADHVGGLPGVLTGRRVAEALVSPLSAPAQQASRAREALDAAGIATRQGWAGLAGRAGDVPWRVLWPTRLLGSSGAVHGESSAANDASVVLLIEPAGLRVLATGDIEPAAQTALRGELTTGQAGSVAPVDVLKVAHHGSAAQDAALHRLLAPRVALFSAGEGNDYGHPTPAARDLLTGVGALVLRTDEHGDLAVGGDGDDLWVAASDSSAAPGRLAGWQRHDQAGLGPAARRAGRPGGRWSRRPSCSSPAARRCWWTGRSSGSGGSRASMRRTWRRSRLRLSSTRSASSTRGRAPPSSVSRGSCWSPVWSRPPTRSSPMRWRTWSTSRTTWCSCCAMAAASAARSCSTRCAGTPRRSP